MSLGFEKTKRVRVGFLFQVRFLICLFTVLLLSSSHVGDVSAAARPATSTTSYGLEWPGDGAVRRMLYWHNPFPIYDATYIFKVYPRKKTTGDNHYYTTFFWGNNGNFTWDTRDIANTYYGAHPYPVPAPLGPGQWEISVNSNDFTTGTEVVWDRWYTQVFRAWRESPTTTWHEFYYDWPDQTKVLRVPVNDPAWAAKNPPSPAIVMGQAPNLNGVSWGGFSGWEEFNGIIRGIHIDGHRYGRRASCPNKEFRQIVVEDLQTMRLSGVDLQEHGAFFQRQFRLPACIGVFEAGHSRAAGQRVVDIGSATDQRLKEGIVPHFLRIVAVGIIRQDLINLLREKLLA